MVLIIIFIALLILAGIVINAVVGNEGFLSKSKNVVDKYKIAQTEERNKLNEYETAVENVGRSTVTIDEEEYNKLKENLSKFEHYGETYTLTAEYDFRSTSGWHNNIKTFNLPEGHYIIKAYCHFSGTGNFIMTCFGARFLASYSRGEIWGPEITEYCTVTSTNQTLSFYNNGVYGTSPSTTFYFYCYRLD